MPGRVVDSGRNTTRFENISECEEEIMNGRKVLFAYDGSTCADEALADLKCAGLPSQLDLRVVSVAEAWVYTAESEEEGEEPIGSEAHGTAVSERARAALDRARASAGLAAERIRGGSPGWSVDTCIYPDSPAWGILHVADEWKPDLIVLGSHGRSAVGRFILGSVSHKVLSEARSSVRIGRRRESVEGAPVRLLVCVDGTPDSDAAVAEIASRSWPTGTSITVLSAIMPVGLFVDPAFAYEAVQWGKVQEGAVVQWERMEAAVKRSAAGLLDAGLLVNTALRDGSPVPTILREAQRLGADCIFLGARGHRFMERFLLGSVSAAVASRAECSVEVVRTVKRENAGAQ